jgi:hypothetical protein
VQPLPHAGLVPLAKAPPAGHPPSRSPAPGADVPRRSSLTSHGFGRATQDPPP